MLLANIIKWGNIKMANQQIDETPVSFPDWHQVLDRDSALESTVRLHHRQAIIGFLAHLIKTQQRASLATASGHYYGAPNRPTLSGPAVGADPLHFAPR
jgi:hypothetical protein